MSLPYFPMYPTDFEADTSHLTLAEDGAYNRLLRLMWMTSGCSLPDDDAWIMRRMRVDKETFECVVLVVIDEFFQRKGGRISSARLAKEYQKTDLAHKKRVAAGSKGGKAKALQTNKNKPSNAKAMPKQPEPEPEPYKEDTNVSLSVSPDCVPHANDVSEALAIYNEAADHAGWPKVQKMSAARTRSLKARLRDCDGMEGWRDALRRAYASDFIREKWASFGFDSLISQSKFTKLMEGSYDNRTNKPATTTNGSANRSDPALEQIARLAGIGSPPGDVGGGIGSDGQEDGPLWMGTGPRFNGS